MSVDRCQEIAADVRRRLGDQIEAECRVTRVRLGLTRFANSHIHQHHGDDTTEVYLRVSLDGRVASSSTTGTTHDHLQRLVDNTLAAARLQPVDPNWPGVNGPTDPSDLGKSDPTTVNAEPGDRAAVVAEFVEAGGGLSAAGYLSTTTLDVAVSTTAGCQVGGRMTSATVDGIHQTDGSAGNGHQSDIVFSALDGRAAGARAADLAERGRGAADVLPGPYEVVLAPECVATMAIFLGVYGFGGRAYADGQSFVELGVQQFDPHFQLVDDLEDPRTGAVGFDAEGTPKHPLALVDEGISRAIAHDRRTAARLSTQSTGHATPASYFGPIPSNLVVSGGDTGPAGLVAGVERGIYVSTFNYCRILDPRTQVVTGLTRNGTFLIENGRLTRPLSNLRFTQSFVEALSPGNVMGVGDDDRSADSEFGPGLVIAPSMRLASWNFTGGARG